MILLDTHVVIWLLISPERLSSAAKTFVRRSRKETGLAICSVTLFEIAQLAARGRVKVAAPLSEFLGDIAERFIVKEITAAAALKSVEFVEPYPRDPIDRLIGAIGFTEGIPLITADERIRKSGQLETIW